MARDSPPAPTRDATGERKRRRATGWTSGVVFNCQMVRPAGFEPATPGLGISPSRPSNPLSRVADEKKNDVEFVPLVGHQPSPDDSATRLRMPQATSADLSKAFGVEVFDDKRK
jgi:hypothetical protein